MPRQQNPEGAQANPGMAFLLEKESFEDLAQDHPTWAKTITYSEASTHTSWLHTENDILTDLILRIQADTSQLQDYNKNNKTTGGGNN